MSVSQIITSLDVITQLPLDKKTYFKTKSDLTFYGVDDIEAFKYYEGMTAYCLETDSFYRWLDIDKPKDPSYEKAGYPFKYPTNVIVNDIDYSGRTFEFFRISTEVDLSSLEAKLDKKVDAALAASKEYSDILNQQAEDREQNLKDALQGTMDSNQAQNILDLENAKRELYKQMSDTSDQLVEELDNLKDDFNQQANDVQESLDNMKDTLDNIPTDQILTDVQLDNLKYLRNTISQEYSDIDFKFERVLRDAFLPEHLRPGLLDLQEQGQIKHTELVNIIDQALEDRKVTQEEKDAINTKMDEFRALNDIINVTILGAYDDINANMDEYFQDRLSDTMKEMQLYFEYSKDGRTAWHKDFVEGDKYMRMKNGINGTWSDSIKIVGENGTGGRYTDYQFSKNKSLYQAPETGWSDAPPEVEPDEYLWMRVGDVLPPMTYPEYWTTVRMSGPQGHPGIQGDQGLPGKPGVDGKTPYTHIAYATGPNGEGFSQISNNNTTHVGFYHDFIQEDSDDPSKYVWTLIKGHDGSQGLPGPIGPDGTPTYLHIAYANSADGSVGFSIIDGAGKSYLGQYVDSIKADSTDPTKYTWTLIKGDKGDQGDRGLQGLQGAKGDQGIEGKTSYTHIAYADTITGTGLSLTDSSKPFIGIYSDFTEASSMTASKYTWSKWQGKDGTDGIPGAKGADGKTPYFHTAWATNSTGTAGFSTSVSLGKTYMGTYSDFTQADSSDPTKYKWVLIKGTDGLDGLQGPKGDQGIPGTKGTDGKTSYTHIAYADNASGGGFSQSPTNKAYIGMYVDFVVTDSTTPGDYKWSLIKGLDGANGTPGAKGADGRTPYLHIAYATNSTGTAGFSTTVSAGKTYIGQYTDYTEADSSDATKYKWTLIKGSNGTNGTNGIDGKTSYTHIAYADTAAGAGLSQNAAGKAYVGMYVDFTQADSSDPAKYKWSLIKGADGANGIPGAKGADGKTPYFHIAYANSADGVTGFSTTVSTNKLYIGTYTDFTQADSTTPSKYKWARMRDERVISTTEPSSKYIGLTWIDTSKVPIQEKYWTGSAWNLIGISEAGIANMIKDANDALQAVMEDALSDGIITNNEARNIAENIAVLESNKRQLDGKYSSISGDPKLDTDQKTTLLSRKTAFNTAHTNLLNVCKAIAKKTSITPAELADYNTKQAAYNTQLTQLGTALDNSQANIYLNNIKGIQIGGRNYLLDSAVRQPVSNNNNTAPISRSLVQIDGAPAYRIAVSTSSPTGQISMYDSAFAAGVSDTALDTLGKSYTFSYEAKIVSSKKDIYIECGPYIHYEEGVRDYAERARYLVSNSSGWVKIYSTIPNMTENARDFPDAMFRFMTWATRSNAELYTLTPDDVLYLRRYKIERGDIATDWTPAPEDVDNAIQDAITNAAQAKSIAEGARNVTSFLTTTADPKNGLITGGALLVGDASGNNAGIVGVTDKGQESVRFYSGGTYNQKNTAPFRVLNNGRLYASNAFISGNINATSGFFGGFKLTVSSFESTNGVLHIDSATGMQTLKDANGVVRNRKGLDSSGEPMDTWYDANGNERYSLTSRGIIYRNYVAESYGEEIIGFIGTTLTVATATTALGWLHKTLTNYWGPALQAPNQAAMWTVEGSWNPSGPTIYSYSAGVNENSENNKQYEGFYYTGKNKLGAKVANGWYLSKTHYGQVYGFTEMMQPDGSTTLEELPSYVSKTFSAFRISAGKKVESKTISAMTQWNMMGQTINGTPIKVPVSGVTLV